MLSQFKRARPVVVVWLWRVEGAASGKEGLQMLRLSNAVLIGTVNGKSYIECDVFFSVLHESTLPNLNSYQIPDLLFSESIVTYH